MKWLLDTNVVSELLRAQPDERVTAWLQARPASDMAISAITAAELLVGVRLLPAGRRRQHLERGVAAMVEAVFHQRILAFDAACAPAYAEFLTLRRAAGRPMQALDAQIAAVARCHQLAMVTRNVRDFAGLGIDVVDPWVALS